MEKKRKINVKEIIGKIGIAIGVVIVVFIIWYSDFLSKKAGEIKIKSRYTFSVRIDSQGNVVQPKSEADAPAHVLAEDFAGLTINQIGDIWIREFVGQFTQKYLSRSMALRKVKIDNTTILDEKTNTVLIAFSAVRIDTTSEYFSSWRGVLNDGRLSCEWVVKFDIDNHHDGTATIYVDSMLTPEDYGIYRYNESIKDSNNSETVSPGADNLLTSYVIRDSALYVTYNGGGNYVSVPVAYDNLLLSEKDEQATKLKQGCYMISTTKTAVLYGGKNGSAQKIPVTLLYTNDMGVNWVTCEIDNIYTADYLYVDFFDEKDGVIVVGYDRRELHESSKIYTTADGGLTWNMIGTGPSTGLIKGVKFIDEKNGFFCYDYIEGMDSNLYMTKDGGRTFSKVMFEAQELDSTASNVQISWNDVYKEAAVPLYDKNNVIVVYLTQGANGKYNDGKTAAKYESSDKGNTWKYIGQYEIEN